MQNFVQHLLGIGTTRAFEAAIGGRRRLEGELVYVGQDDRSSQTKM